MPESCKPLIGCPVIPMASLNSSLMKPAFAIFISTFQPYNLFDVFCNAYNMLEYALEAFDTFDDSDKIIVFADA